jgi:ADP-heptose:LPS heptosyltransferase
VVVLKRFLLRSFHLLRLFLYFPFDSLVRRHTNKIQNQTLLIIKLEGIGDYILFRNFIEILKNHPQFSEYRITLCGNTSFKNFAESFDSSFINDFIWMNPKKFQTNPLYRKKMLREIRHRGFDTVIYPTHSRDSLLGDSIVRCSGARNRIGTAGDDVHAKDWERKFFNRYYTQLIKIPDNIYFEFLRNKNFFEQLLDEQLSISKPFLRITQSSSFDIPKPYVVMCPDAQLYKRRWDINNFLILSEHLYKQYQLISVYTGGKPIDRENIELKNHQFIIDLTGKTTLTETVELISAASLVVANDTGVSHIGVALDKPVVVISNGNHYGRFTYLPEVYDKISYVFPPKFYKYNFTSEQLVQNYKYGSFLNINTITIEQVLKTVHNAINNYCRDKNDSR